MPEESMTKKQKQTRGSSTAAKWLGYRPEIRVIDCTVRDGGLMNNHRFNDTVIRAIYQACAAAGIDYMEIGYKTSKKIVSQAEYGTWKFCDEEDIRRIVGENETSLKISVMADAERTDYHEDILPADRSVVDMIRVATYIHQIPTAVDMIQDAHDKGYETTVNLMAVSTVQEWELDQALEALVQTPVDVVYLVDSFGSLYSEQVQYLTRKYLRYVKQVGKEVGIHTHNNQQLAYANTVEAIVMGANCLDSSLAGLGRGAGNCPTELLVGFLHNPKFKLRPLLQCIQEHIEPLRAELKWGYDIPYMITGQLNQHPRAAMAFNSQKEPGDIVAFYDAMMEKV
jgi:4-hydroxy 2-oxovalerate aldolase